MIAGKGQAIRVRGTVQGVGFRPTVWRIARELGLAGRVRNDADGVLIELAASSEQVDAFIDRLRQQCPPLARIEQVERSLLADTDLPAAFEIVASDAGQANTAVAADAATCDACAAEIRDPADRRHRYPFTNCTHCGPRLSIVRAIPYDRANTSMAAFPMCSACAAEYADPADRRFHAQPNACPECGPRVWLEDAQGEPLDSAGWVDPIDHAAALIRAGQIVAIKGIGGIHLACDAASDEAVDRLRARKHRYFKPLALMATDVDRVRRYVQVDAAEAEALQQSQAPIVVLDQRHDAPPLAAGLAPGQRTLGFMLPYSPLHRLLLDALDGPIVLTSGNRSDEPQCIANDDARQRLSGIADCLLLHDRDIVNRLDDSVLRRYAGQVRPLRRARGFAPAPIALPAGLAGRPLLALGSELKNSFALARSGQAILSQHLGDLEDAATFAEYRASLDLYQQLFDHRAEAVAVDLHPNYLSTQHGRQLAAERQLPLVEVQHHHAHIASCLADNGWPGDAGPVLGIALDGLGFGDDGTLWGGEFLRADYRAYRRLGRFMPVAMPGGAQAMREPWRNSFAQLQACFGWQQVREHWASLDIVQYIDGKPVGNLQRMLERGLNSPLSSSAGRLFDAVAAALGVCREQAGYEGQAAIELEALAEPVIDALAGQGYPFALADGDLAELRWEPMWQALLADLAAGENVARIAARFHLGLADAVSGLALELARRDSLDTVALSGGVFQNRLLLEAVDQRLRGGGLRVLLHRQVPANDGGLSLGQLAVVAAAD